MSVSGTLAILTAMLFWSAGPLAIKFLTGYFDSWEQNFFRYLAACVVMLPLLLAACRRGLVTRSMWIKALPVAFCNIMMQVFWARSLYYINPGFMSLLAKTSIIWIAVLGFALLPEERPLVRSPYFWAGLLLSLAGVAGVILSTPGFSLESSRLGIVLILVAAAMWGCYTIAARKAFRKTNSVIGFAIICLYTTIGLGVTAVIVSDPFADMPRTWAPWGVAILSGLSSIAGAHTLYYASMRRIGATIPALVTLALPFLILPQSMLFFGEPMILGQWAWGAVLIAGALFCVLAQAALRQR